MSRSIIIALVLALGLAAWVASGQLAAPGEAEQARAEASREEKARPQQPQAPLFRVQIRQSTAEPVVREVVLHGHTEAARSVQMRAEVDGRVVEVPVAKGSRVEEGQVVVRLDERDRQAQRSMADAALRRAQLDADAARKLNAKGFQAETALTEKLAALAESEAMVERTQLALDDTEIHAPFAGVLDKRPVEIGDYVDTGDTVATILELDPLLVVGDAAEVDVSALKRGAEGYAVLPAGQRVDGRLRYVSSAADEATRTFRVELEVPNPDNAIGSGQSATLHLPVTPVAAHRVSSSILVLDDAGRLGVRTVDGDDRVRFHAAAIARSDAESVWLTGLPETLRLITTGQGFVREGQQVVPVAASEATSGAAT